MLPRRPLRFGGLVLPGVRGGRGTGHRAIVGNTAVGVPWDGNVAGVSEAVPRPADGVPPGRMGV
ncbi:hypothetical protein SBD_7554 [Streptomyces bottropensis ATCC 25435]|uniref:Uncharacterized protein n=1 Tax=Streptomyces bottropensis ATCC 25435 TaxID=1054862 RepID=M3E4R5_9ACTN|nr:hypothetical protein SBD_7554 [Streptomyces bottropensis ATCC 25435]